MTSRLILVGVVGTLGISVPTWPEIQGWMIAAHSWTAGQLAAWDTSARSDADSIAMPPIPWQTTVGAKPDAGSAGGRAGAVAQRAGGTDLDSLEDRQSDGAFPAFEPIVVDEGAWDVAYDLNREAQELDVTSGAATANRQPREDGPMATSDARRRDDLLPPVCRDVLELKLMVELFQAAELPEGNAPPTARSVAERRPRAPMAPVVCVFTRSSTAQRPVEKAGPTPRVSGLLQGGPASGPVQTEPLSEAMPGTGEELNCFAEPIDQPTSDTAVATAPMPVFDPIDPATNPGDELVEELNRASDGLAVVHPAPVLDPAGEPESPARQEPISVIPEQAQGTAQHVPAPRVAQAIRLTREAALAWMQVLAEPAIVQMSAR